MKKVFFLILCMSLTINTFAQQYKNKIEAQRVAFITQRLNLTPEEAQGFWPIFNQYNDKLKQIRFSFKNVKFKDEMSDVEAEKIILSEFDKESKELELKKEYYQKLKKVISDGKIARLYKADRDFKTLLLERIQDKRQNNNHAKREDN